MNYERIPPLEFARRHKSSWMYRSLLQRELPERMAANLAAVAWPVEGGDSFLVYWIVGGRAVLREYPTRDWLTDALIARIVLEALG